MKKLTTFFALIIALSLNAQTNIVTNGTFEDGTTGGWTLDSRTDAMTGTIDGSNPISGSKSMHVSIVSNSGSDLNADFWKQTLRWPMSMTKGAKYAVSFKAKASAAVTMRCQNELNITPWDVFKSIDFDLNTSVQTFSYTTDAITNFVGDGCFAFYFGHFPAGTEFWVDDITITEVAPLTDGNICNGDFENNYNNGGYSGNPTLNGWTTVNWGGTVSFAIENTSAITGTNSMKISGIAAPKTDGWWSQLMWWFAPIPGQKYMFEFKAKVSTGSLSLTTEAFPEKPGVSRDRSLDLFTETFNISTTTNTYKLSLPSAPVATPLAVNPLNGYYYLSFWTALLTNGQSLWLDDIKIYQYTDTATAIYQITDNQNIKIFGLSNKISIETNHKGLANIYTASGQLVKQSKLVSGVNQITVNKGMYFVQLLEAETIVKSTKVIIN